jgi:hypothetical protein
VDILVLRYVSYGSTIMLQYAQTFSTVGMILQNMFPVKVCTIAGLRLPYSGGVKNLLCAARQGAHRSLSRIQLRDSKSLTWSGRKDLNLRLHGPEPCALPGCATPRIRIITYHCNKI